MQGFLYASDMRQQADINDIVNELVNTYSGQTIAYFGSFPGESVVPVAYYIDKLRGTSPMPSLPNNRADGWGMEFPDSLTPYFTHEVYEVGKQYPKGTILIWNSPHLAIVICADGSNTADVFEQNGDPDGSPCGIKSRIINNEQRVCTYALMPLLMPKQVMEPIIRPIPVIQPAPVPKPASLPVAPVFMPTSTETYFIRRTIPCYPHSSMALQHDIKYSCGDVNMGQYYIWRKFGDMLNVTQKRGEPGSWINPADNRIIESTYLPDLSQKPISWQDSYRVFAEPKSYQVNTTIIVNDLAGQRKDKRIYLEQFYDMAGTFTGPDGYEYLRPDGAATANLWYGIEPQYLTPEDELYNLSEGDIVHPLTWYERLWAQIADIISFVPKVIHRLKNKQEKK